MKKILFAVGSYFLVSIQLAVLSVPLLAAMLQAPSEPSIIQEAIDAAADGDVVLVPPGEYVISEPLDFNRLHDQEDPESPPVKNITLRSQAGSGETVLRMASSVEDVRVVVFRSGESEESVMEGFTLIGGPVAIVNSSPILKNCRISGSSSSGVICWDASPKLMDCTISGNSGALVCYPYRPGGGSRGKNCVDGKGGGVSCTGTSSVFLEGCTIIRNRAERGAGLYSSGDSILTIKGCTIAANRGTGILCEENATLKMTNCIVWENEGDSILVEDDTIHEVRYSCIQMEGGSWPGDGNINEDPLFCRWSDSAEVHVDGTHTGAGDGSEANPYPSLEAALEYSLALSSSSPCLGSGEDGANRGADHSVCNAAGPTRFIHLGRGTYSMGDMRLDHNVSIEGDGDENTVIEGTIYGLCTDSLLARVTVLGERSGGVVVDPGEAPKILECTISGQLLEWGWSGRGVTCRENSSPRLVGCTIMGNSGGLYCGENSTPELINCKISENRTEGGEGGVYCDIGSSPSLTDCEILGNRTWSDGGGLYCAEDSSPKLIRCTIAENTTAGWGAGAYCAEGSSATFTDSLILRNFSRGRGGSGIFCSGSSPEITGCTISENSSGGVIGGSPVLTNCIVWGNTGESIRGGAVVVNYSCIEVEGEEPWPGEGNIQDDPLFCGWGSAAEVFVDSSNSNSGDGSEANPFSSFETALEYSFALSSGSPCLDTGEGGTNMGADTGVCGAAAAPERAIHLAPGNYSIRGQTLAHHAKLSGAGADETVIEGTVFGLRGGSVLSNLTVTGGEDGGIIVTPGEAPAIKDCKILGNSYVGIDCRGASPTLTNCTISENLWGLSCDEGASVVATNCTMSKNRNHGISCYRSSLVLKNCTISENGGGVLGDMRSTLTLTDCEVLGNQGHAVWYRYGSTGEITGCLISGNSGSGVIGNSSLTVMNCTIAGNTAREGGGVTGAPRLFNCLITGNSALRGGGLYCDGSSPTLINCTIAENSGMYGGGIFCQGISSPVLTNCILWGSRSLWTEGPIWLDEKSVPRITHSCIEGIEVWEGEGNINKNPLFLVPGRWDDGGTPNDLDDDIWTAGNYRLRPTSPAIGAGTIEGAPEIDMEGNARNCGEGVDLGVYESGLCEPRVARFQRGDVNADSEFELTDVIVTLSYQFLGGESPSCLKSLDTDDSGSLDLTDAVYLLGFLFLGGPEPKAPFEACGTDLTTDGLTCEFFTACE